MDSNVTNLLSKALDVYSLRQKLTAANIANIDTPDFTAKQLSFEDQLQTAMSTDSNPADLSKVEPKVVDSGEKPVIENQLMDLAQNQIQVQLAARVLRDNFNQMRTAISGTPR